MELTSFSVFLTVVDEMSFTRAAERLYMTQQSVSSHIKRLETNYHVRLFERRPVLKLTAEGEALAFYARGMVDSEEAMMSRFADLSELPTGILRMGISHQRSQVFMPGIWNRYHAVCGNISVRLREQMTNRLLEQLQSGALDLIVGVFIPQLSNLTVRLLSQEATYCVFHEKFLSNTFPDDWEQRLERYGQEGIDLMEFKDLPLLLPSHDNRMRQPVDQLFRKHNAIPRVALETSSHGLLYQLSFQGSGIALVSPLSLYEHTQLMAERPPYCHAFRVQGFPLTDVSLAWRNDVEQPQYVMAMAEAVEEVFEVYNETVRLCFDR
jgi:DNA-binding transcriptional LysR family regulator